MKTTGKSVTPILSILLACFAGACEKKPAEGPEACCAQPDIPRGVAKFSVVADEVSGPSDGQKVIVRAAMLEPAKREQMYGPMKVLYAYAMKRTAFEPTHFEGWFYASESAAKAGGDGGLLAKDRARADRSRPALRKPSEVRLSRRGRARLHPQHPWRTGAGGRHERHLPHRREEEAAALRREIRAQDDIPAR